MLMMPSLAGKLIGGCITLDMFSSRQNTVDSAYSKGQMLGYTTAVNVYYNCLISLLLRKI